MNADPAYPALATLMACCFHQDMDLEAETVPEAVALYVRGLSRADGNALRADITGFLQTHAADLDEIFLQTFGDDLDPREVDFGIQDFLRMIASLIDDPAAFRDFLEEDLQAEFPHLRRLARACTDLPLVSAEARRLGVQGADDLPHAMALHLTALSPAQSQALMAEMRGFQSLYGHRATSVFAKRWLDLKATPIGTFEEFKRAVEAIAADTAGVGGFDAA